MRQVDWYGACRSAEAYDFVDGDQSVRLLERERTEEQMIDGNVEDQRSCLSMDVPTYLERLNECGILGKVRKQSQLDL